MKNNPIITEIAELLKKNCSDIIRIFLISYKTDNFANLTSFKLALILKDSAQNLPELECRLYIDVECELPFDLVIYRQGEFDRLKEEIGTFAWKINNSGAEIYGKRIS